MNSEAIREHFRKYKWYYITGIICVGAGVGLGVLLKSRPLIINNNPVVNVPITNNVGSINFGGYQHKIIKCLETGQIWESVKDAAEAMDVSTASMSKHVNGHKPDVRQLHFGIIGLSAG